MPSVRLVHRGTEPRMSSVDNDDLAIGNLAAAHFLDRGYKHFAYYARQQNQLNDREFGYGALLESRGHAHQFIEGVPSHPSYRVNALDRQADEKQQLLQWLKQLVKPVAVFCVADNAALIIAERCRELGFEVPHEVAILGVDNDIPVCELAFPPLSSIQTAGEEAGYRAAELLEQMVVHGSAPASLALPPIRVVSRQSTDAVITGDPWVTARCSAMTASSRRLS